MAKSIFRHNLEQAVISRVARLASWLGQRLSLSSLRCLADRFADLVMLVTAKRQRLADANIAAAFPELSPSERASIRRASVRNVCRTMMELLKLPSMTPDQLKDLVKIDAGPQMRETLTQRGILLLTAHYGNWEWLGARLAQELPITSIARDAAHDVTASLINNARASHGMKVIGREDLRRMMQVLRDHEVLGILPDQHALQGGILRDFLGRPAWTFTGPALLAARTGAQVLPMFCVRKADGTFEVEVMPPLELVETGDRDADVAVNTQMIMDAISAAIRRHPEQWLWLHDRWKKKPGQIDAAPEVVR